MICNKNGCINECRVKMAENEIRDGRIYNAQTHYCLTHGDRCLVLRAEGQQDIVEELR
jgi:hypothetical protein